MATLDIKRGDILTIGSKDYPIRAMETWNASGFSKASFSRFASVTASTKRAPAASAGGLVTAAAASIASLKCTPLEPVDSETRQRLLLNTPMTISQTFVDGDSYLRLVVEVLP